MLLTPYNKYEGKYNLYNIDIHFRNVIRIKMNPNLAHYSAAWDSVSYIWKVQIYFPYIQDSIAAPIHCAPPVPRAWQDILLWTCAAFCQQPSNTHRETTQNETSFTEQRREVCSDLIHRRSVSTNEFLRTPDFHLRGREFFSLAMCANSKVVLGNSGVTSTSVFNKQILTVFESRKWKEVENPSSKVL